MIGCTAFGSGNAESRYTFQLENAQITGGTAEGVLALFGTSTIADTIIQTCALSAIVARNQATLSMTNVAGAGNTGYGVELRYGAIVIPSACTVTGTTNDLFVGGLGANAWAAIPLTDLDQLVRIGA
jgi:hypothetical protein